MARYASQPALNIPQGQSPMFGMPAANHYSMLTGMGNNSNLARSAQNAPPNLAAQPSVKPLLADTAGIQQALAKVGEQTFEAPGNWLQNAIRGAWTRLKSAETQVAGPSAPGKQTLPAQTPSFGGTAQAANRPGPSGAMQGGGAPQGQFFSGQQSVPVGTGLNPLLGRNPLAAAGRAGWAGLAPGSPSPLIAPSTLKNAAMVPGPAGMQPTPGLTANVPPPPGPPGMAQPMPQQPMPGPSGTGVPGQPAQPPPGQPQQGQPMPQPPIAPMSEPPPQPLPANPRPQTPPYPKTSQQALQESHMLGLLEAKQQVPMGGMGEDMKNQNMAIGAKLAHYLDRLGIKCGFWKNAGLGTVAKSLFGAVGHEAAPLARLAGHEASQIGRAVTPAAANIVPRAQQVMRPAITDAIHFNTSTPPLGRFVSSSGPPRMTTPPPLPKGPPPLPQAAARPPVAQFAPPAQAPKMVRGPDGIYDTVENIAKMSVPGRNQAAGGLAAAPRYSAQTGGMLPGAASQAAPHYLQPRHMEMAPAQAMRDVQNQLLQQGFSPQVAQQRGVAVAQYVEQYGQQPMHAYNRTLQQAHQGGMSTQLSMDKARQAAAQPPPMDDELARLLGMSPAQPKWGSDLGGSTMKGWQWNSLRRDEHEAQKSWLPRLFASNKTPLTELLASPGKSSLLTGLLGGAAGAGLGALAGSHVPGVSPVHSALAGGGAGALLGGVQGYSHRREKNDEVLDALRHTLPGATVEDYHALKKQEKGGLDTDARFGATCPHCGSTDTHGARTTEKAADGRWKHANTHCQGCNNGFSFDFKTNTTSKMAALWCTACKDPWPCGVKSHHEAVEKQEAEKQAVDIVLEDGTNLGDHQQLGVKLAEKLYGAARGNPNAELLHHAMVDHLQALRTKQAAQAVDGSFTPRRSATGESSGLSFAHKSDDYAQGQDAWAATSKYFHGGSRIKKEPNPFTGDHDGVKKAMSPFATGFFRHCDSLGLDDYQVKQAVHQALEHFGDVEDARTELLDGLSKRASWGSQLGKGMLEGGRNFLGMGSKAVAPAAKALGHEAPVFSRAMTHAPEAATGFSGMTGAVAPAAARAPTMMGQQFGRAHPIMHNVLQSGAGALGGSFNQDDSVLPDMGMNPHLAGALYGAAAFNPYLGRMAKGRGAGSSVLNPLMRGVKGSIIGGDTGALFDMAGNVMGMEDTHFSRLGNRLGGAAGLASGAGRSMRNIGAAGSQARNWGKGLESMAEGALHPIGNPFTKGTGLRSTLDPRLGRYGYNAARFGGGILGTGMAVQGFENRFANKVPQMADAYLFGEGGQPGRVQAIGGYAQDLARQTMGDTGLFNEQGRFSPMQGLNQSMGPMLSHTDGLLHSLGMDPTRMNPLQKMMILGGGGLAAGGAMTGHPLLAGAGGMSLLGGAWPSLMHGQDQGAAQGGYGRGALPGPAAGQPLPPNQAAARDEYQRQLQQQQQFRG